MKRELIPSDYIKSKTITISKKGKANEYANYRSVALLSHDAKILLNIAKPRLEGEIDQTLGEEQFSFKARKGT